LKTPSWSAVSKGTSVGVEVSVGVRDGVWVKVGETVGVRVAAVVWVPVGCGEILAVTCAAAVAAALVSLICGAGRAPPQAVKINKKKREGNKYRR
jgi:hypothetical protein